MVVLGPRMTEGQDSTALSPPVETREGAEEEEVVARLDGQACSWIEELTSQRDAAVQLSRKLSEELESKRRVLEAREANALRLCAEAEARLAKARADYATKHVTMRKKLLLIVGCLALGSFLGWAMCAIIAAQEYPALAVTALLPVTLMFSSAMVSYFSGQTFTLFQLLWPE